MEDIYVHTSKFAIIEALDNCEQFEPKHLYSKCQTHDLSCSEYGRINLHNLRINIIIGRIVSEGCHWCGTDPIVIQLTKPSFNEYYMKFCVECPNCLARGPVTKVLASVLIDEDNMNWIKTKLKYDFSQIKPWDNKL